MYHTSFRATGCNALPTLALLTDLRDHSNYDQKLYELLALHGVLEQFRLLGYKNLHIAGKMLAILDHSAPVPQSFMWIPNGCARIQNLAVHRGFQVQGHECSKESYVREMAERVSGEPSAGVILAHHSHAESIAEAYQARGLRHKLAIVFVSELKSGVQVSVKTQRLDVNEKARAVGGALYEFNAGPALTAENFGAGLVDHFFHGLVRYFPTLEAEQRVLESCAGVRVSPEYLEERCRVDTPMSLFG